MTIPMDPSITTETINGPWNSRYVVGYQTLAVNVAHRAAHDLTTADQGFDTLAKYERDGSINGFWGVQLRRLNILQRRAVVARAQFMLDSENIDLWELFDGQK